MFSTFVVRERGKCVINVSSFTSLGLASVTMPHSPAFFRGKSRLLALAVVDLVS